MKTLFATLFALSLLALLTLGVERRTTATNINAPALADCDNDHKDEGDDEDSSVRALACDKDDVEEGDDQDSYARALACDHDEEGDDEDSFA